MGLKRRTFTGTLKSAVMAALKGSNGLSKRELLAKVRLAPRAGASIRKLGAALEALVAEGKVVAEGQRAKMSFRRAK